MVTEQLDAPGAPATRVQVADGEKASPAADDETVTVPAGLDFVPAASVSVTVTETDPG
jgi:hypothetical protein